MRGINAAEWKAGKWTARNHNDDDDDYYYYFFYYCDAHDDDDDDDDNNNRGDDPFASARIFLVRRIRVKSSTPY